MVGMLLETKTTEIEMKKWTALKTSPGYPKNAKARTSRTRSTAHTPMRMTSAAMRPEKHSNMF